MFHPTAESEARDLLRVQGGAEKLAACLQIISGQLQVMQARTQTMLGLATLCITVTGFSGPRIAASNLVSRWTMAAGLSFTLLSVLTLLENLRVQWVTQYDDQDPLQRLTAVITQRNVRTSRFLRQIAVLGAGLAFYVFSVVAYLAVGDPPR